MTISAAEVAIYGFVLSFSFIVLFKRYTNWVTVRSLSNQVIILLSTIPSDYYNQLLEVDSHRLAFMLSGDKELLDEVLRVSIKKLRTEKQMQIVKIWRNKLSQAGPNN